MYVRMCASRPFQSQLWFAAGDQAFAWGDLRKGSRNSLTMRKGNLRKGNLCKGQNALVHLHRGPHISQRALEATLKTVREHGLPEHSSRRSQFRARAETVLRDTPYGPVMQALHLGAESPDIYISHPLALLYRTAKECEPFRRVLQNTLRKHPCSVSNPWRVVIYFDEITPTDPCSAKVDRHKLQGFY